MSQRRQTISSGNPLEPVLGYSRAVRMGPHVAVTGTAAVGEDGRAFGIGDAEAQARRIFEIIGRALAEAGASFADVVRTRVLLVDIGDWEAVGRVHGEVFEEIRPATTVMQVSRFIDPAWLVEIEVDAIVAEGRHPAGGQPGEAVKDGDAYRGYGGRPRPET